MERKKRANNAKKKKRLQHETSPERLNHVNSPHIGNKNQKMMERKSSNMLQLKRKW